MRRLYVKNEDKASTNVFQKPSRSMPTKNVGQIAMETRPTLNLHKHLYKYHLTFNELPSFNILQMSNSGFSMKPTLKVGDFIVCEAGGSGSEELQKSPPLSLAVL